MIPTDSQESISITPINPSHLPFLLPSPHSYPLPILPIPPQHHQISHRKIITTPTLTPTPSRAPSHDQPILYPRELNPKTVPTAVSYSCTPRYGGAGVSSVTTVNNGTLLTVDSSTTRPSRRLPPAPLGTARACRIGAKASSVDYHT